MDESNVVDLCSDDDRKLPAKRKKAESDSDSDSEEIEIVDREDNMVEVTHQVLKLEWTGPPIAWKRPETMVRVIQGKACYQKNTTDPNKQKIASVRDTLRRQVLNIAGSRIPFFAREIPLIAEFEFYRKLPKTHFKNGDRSKGSLKHLCDSINTFDTSTPDCDNLVKFAMEAMQEVVYHDDVQIVKQSGVKMLDTVEPYEGRTLVRIRQCFTTDLPMPDNPIHRPAKPVQQRRYLD